MTTPPAGQTDTGVTAYLGLGSNTGDRRGHLQWAVERLAQTPGVQVGHLSTLRDTEPVDCPDPAPFLNGALRIHTTLDPHGLLAVCKSLELERGRDLDAPPNSHRPLDLDVLLYGDEVVDTRDLQVPHPKLREREFVREPLRELGVDPDQVPVLPVLRVFALAIEMSAQVAVWQSGGCTVGLVPTMGSLHRGHVSLVQRARRECDRVVVSIFVNPLQFGVGEDFSEYPRDMDRDLDILRSEGVDAVFAPAAHGMYGDGFCTNLSVGREAQGMESDARPDHFAGVVTVVAALLAIVRPQRAYFGRKDAQQVAVVRRMIADLGFATALMECPICREPDGLALSSRNAYLSAEDRAASSVLYRALDQARGLFGAGERDAEVLLQQAQRVLDSEPRARVEYLVLRREGDLQPLPPGPVHGGRMLVAASFGTAGAGNARPPRLIDNMSLADPLEVP